MLSLLEPIQADSLITIFVQKFENLILSGQIQIGEKLPSERDLAGRMGVSRQIVHEGLLDLETKGLVSLKSRSGWVVNDYRRSGSLLLLNSLFEYGEGSLDREVVESLFRARILIESDAASLAAKNRSPSDLNNLEEIVKKERAVIGDEAERKVELDFEFHLAMAAASGNLVYPLLLNSCRALYTNLTGLFFRNNNLYKVIIEAHEGICAAVRGGDALAAEELMRRLLREGEEALKGVLCSKNRKT